VLNVELALEREVDESKKGNGKQGDLMMTTEHPATSTFALALPWVWQQESQSWMQCLEGRAFATLVSF
jgi:hypothetical protein